MVGNAFYFASQVPLNQEKSIRQNAANLKNIQDIVKEVEKCSNTIKTEQKNTISSCYGFNKRINLQN